jgi:hypothetical protein
MLEKLSGMILKDPCKNCLVKSTCQHTPFFSRPKCERKEIWREKSNKLYYILTNIRDYSTITILALVALLLLLTFCLGIWKWCDLIVALYNKNI